MVTPDGYLGADLSQMYNEVGDYCWAMSSDKYCQALVTNVEEVLQKGVCVYQPNVTHQ